MNLSNNLTEIILAIIAVFTIGIVIKISINRRNKSSNNRYNVKDTNAGGDIVFGNKSTQIKDERRKQ